MSDKEFLLSDVEYSDPELQELQQIMRANTTSLKVLSDKEEKKQKVKLKMQGVLAQQAVLLRQKESHSSALAVVAGSIKKKKSTSKTRKKHTRVDKCDPNATTSSGVARKHRAGFFRPTMLCEDSDSETDLPDMPGQLMQTPRRSRAELKSKSQMSRELDFSYEIDFDNKDSTDSSITKNPLSVTPQAKSNKAQKRSRSATSPSTGRSPARKARKPDWRKVKNVPLWMPSSAQDSERDEMDKTTTTRRTRFSEDEVAALYAAAQPYKHNLKNNFKDIKEEHKQEVRQLECVRALQEAVNDVVAEHNERQRHRWRIWAKLHDLRHTTKKKVASDH